MKKTILASILTATLVPVWASSSQIKTTRLSAEKETENKLFLKLEESRLDDEQKRAQKLFGNTDLKQVKNKASTPQQKIIIVKRKKLKAHNPKSIHEPSSHSLPLEPPSSTQIITSEQIKPFKRKDHRFYLSGLFGVAEFKDIADIKNKYSTGFTIGAIYDYDFILEGGFTYSQFYVDHLIDSQYSDKMDQYNFIIASKYAPLFSGVSPQIGALLSYTYREYDGSALLWSFEDIGQINTKSLDIGLSFGVDFELTRDFILGGEFRHFWNLKHSDKESEVAKLRGESIEAASYYTLAVSAKFLF